MSLFGNEFKHCYHRSWKCGRDLTGTSGLFDKAVVDRGACGLGCDLGLFDKKATDRRAVGSEHLSGPSFAVVVGGSGAGLWGYVYSACTTCA